MDRGRFSCIGFACAVFASVVAIGSAALADPLGDIKSAAIATANAHSYHFTMSSSAMGNVQGDMLYPGTLHEVMAKNGMEMIVLPSASYMKMNGKWMKYPGSTSAIFAGASATSILNKMNTTKYHVTDLGMRSFGGSTMHAYAVESTLPSGKLSKSVDYVDGSGRLAGFQIDDVVMHMTNFGEPVHLAAPM